GAQGTASDMERQVDEILRLKKRLNGILQEHSGREIAEVERDTDRDHFMSGEQAKEWGLVDDVIATMAASETDKKDDKKKKDEEE
ncbi:MAG: ATP-dependent Clp protease proteolytic subunit, partial [Planctomycetota bacterium]